MELSESPAKMSEMKWKELICTKRGLEVQMVWKALFVGWDKYD